MRRENPAWIKHLTTRLAPFAAAVSAGLVLWHAAHDAPRPSDLVPAPLIYPGSATAPATAKAVIAPMDGAPRPLAQQAGVASTIEVVVGRNDTLDGIFRKMALDTTDLAAIRNLPGIRQSLDFLKPGDAIKVTRHGGEVQELTRTVSETKTLEVVREPAGFEARMINTPAEIRVRTATATIDSSLFQAAGAAKMSDVVALKLTNIFAWDIDFALDVREGDRFTATYEQVYQNGRYVRDGDVLAAEFVANGRTYRAVRFQSDSGKVDYYTPEGRPMRKAFLRAPVEFTRISSVFNPHRMHPILNRIRGHMGTDYAAPIGTPVHAAGDGLVSFRGTRGGYGNAIVLAHGRNVSTLYGHLSRFARNLHAGEHVRQGETIGYVGMTGLATGPHLHYEYLSNGVHMDPQTVRLPGAEPLEAAALHRFVSETAPVLAGLEPRPAAGPSAAPAATTPSASTAATTASAAASMAQSIIEPRSKSSPN